MQCDRNGGLPREGNRRIDLEDLRRDTGGRRTGHAHASRKDQRLGGLPGRAYGGQRAGGGDPGAWLVTEQRRQVRDVAGLRGGAQVALVRVALVVEGQHIGQIGPPLEHLQDEVTRYRPPVVYGLLAGERSQQRPAEAGEVAGPVRDGGAHGAASTRTWSEPASGRFGSLSTRRISLAATLSLSGSGAQRSRPPRLRYRIWTTPSTPLQDWMAASSALDSSG